MDNQATHHFPWGKPSIASKVLVVMLIVVSALLILSIGGKIMMQTQASSGVKPKQYQALFLTNGQVYFGKISQVDNNYVKIRDIFYLQVQQTVQPKDAKADPNAQPQVSLAKLGSELHGPDDVMYVSRTQVLFWENIKDDGKVVQAIKEFKAKK